MGNLNDNFKKVNFDKLDILNLPELEQFMLHKISNLSLNFKKNFEIYNFHTLYKDLLNFCTVDLSAFYFDIRKDTLYCDDLGTEKRKSTIVFLNILLEILLKWFAPILSFTTEEIYRLVKINSNKSIHLEDFPNIPSKWNNKKLEEKWMELIKIREVCNSSIELKRASKEIGSSLEASLIINLDDKMFKNVEGTDFAELCITSEAKIETGKTKEIVVETFKAEGNKCPVCWKINKNRCERHFI